MGQVYGILIKLVFGIFGLFFSLIGAAFTEIQISFAKYKADKKSREERKVIITNTFSRNNFYFSFKNRQQLFAGERQYLIPANRQQLLSTTPHYASPAKAQRLLLSNNEDEAISIEGSEDVKFLEGLSCSNINMVVSGGEQIYRNEAISYVCNDANARSVPVIIIHCNNTDLINKFKNSLLTSCFVPVDGISFTYNPFRGLNPIEISNMIVDSFPERYNANRNSQNQLMIELIKIIAAIVNASGKTLSLASLAKCPVKDLASVLEKQYQKNVLSKSLYDSLYSDLITSQNESTRLDGYLQELSQKAKHLLTNTVNSVDFDAALDNGSIIAINIGSSLNDILIGLVTEHLRLLFSKQKRMVVVLDGLNLSFSEKLTNLLVDHQECNYSISCEDAFTSLKSDMQKFKTLMGRVSRAVFFKHKSTGTNEHLSEFFAEYEHHEIEITTHSGTIVPKRSWVERKDRRRRVQAQDLINMTDTQICVYKDGNITFADMKK